MLEGWVDGSWYCCRLPGTRVEQPASTATSEAVANTAPVRRRTDRKVVVMSSRKSAHDAREKVTVDGCTDRASQTTRLAVVLSLTWTTVPKSASSSPRGVPRSPRTGRATSGRAAPGPRAAAQRGRRPGRDERRVLRQAGTRLTRRRLRRRPGRDRPRPAARRRRTRPPVPPRPGRRRHQRGHAAPPPQPSSGPVRPSLQWTLDAITTGAGDRRQQQVRPARHQPPRPRAVRRPLQRPQRRRRTSPGSPSSTAPPTGSTPTGTSPPT